MSGLSNYAQEHDTVYIKRLLEDAIRLQTSNLDSTNLLAHKAMELSIRAKYNAGIRNACIRIGSVWMAKGRNDSSFIYLRKASEISKSNQDYKGLVGASILLGYAHLYQSNADSAFFYFYEGLRYAQRANSPELRTQIYNSLGNLLSEYKDYTKSLSYYRIGLFLAKKYNQPLEQTTAYMGIGGVYYFLNKYKNALMYYQLVDSLTEGSEESIAHYQNLNNLALCYQELHQNRLALHYFHRALLFYKSNEMLSEEANLCYNLACLYADIRNTDSAKFYIHQAIDKSQDLKDLKKEAECKKLLSDLYLSEEKYKEAFHTLAMYLQLSDSLLNSEKINSISEMQTKYETGLKERKIELLNLQNESRTRERNYLASGAMLLLVLTVLLFWQRNKVKQAKARSDGLLLNILPSEVADELKKTGASKARQYQNVTVMFTDFVDFTKISEMLSPSELVEEINKNFIAFDRIMDKYGVEKIKTIGDAYLAVCGLPIQTADHAERMIKAAIELQEFIKNENSLFQLRIGMNSGPVVAGIVGTRKFAFDIWGDTVNTASRMESISEPGKINISHSTYLLVKERFNCDYRGKINAKGKGAVDAYFIEGIKTV
ncbi:MAG: adenylate/guanylate cyclase domain-containing protein [Bacteroidia bacterium]